MTGEVRQKYIKIIGGGLVGIEVAYILARNGFVVHIFNHEQPSMCHIERDIPFKKEMQEELLAWNSPTFLTAKRLGVNLETIDHDFVKIMEDSLKKFSNVSFIDAELTELNLNELSLISTGNNTTKLLIENLSKYVGENKIEYFHPAPMKLAYIDLKYLYHDHDDFYHVNLNEEEYKILSDNLKRYRSFYDSSKLLNEISVEKRAENNSLRTFLRPIFNENSKPYASIKLKKQDGDYSLINFYSALSDEEQARLIGGINAFKGANISEFSKLYKRTYLHSSACLNKYLQVKNYHNLFIGGSFLGIGGVHENLLVANYLAYNLMSEAEGRNLQECPKNSCTSVIIEKLLQKSVLNYMLLNLNYDIIKKSDRISVESDAVTKFKENYYGKYFQRNNHLCR